MEVDTIQSAESMDVDTNNYKPGKIFIFVFFTNSYKPGRLFICVFIEVTSIS